MGKNRKSRNVANQVQEQNETTLEIKNNHRENSEDFLTSDDFCIVQKKKGSKKSESESLVFRTRSYSEKKITSDEGCHMSFWTCKSNGTINSCSTSIHSSDSSCQSNEQLDIPLERSYHHSNESVESNEEDVLKKGTGSSEDIVKAIQSNSLIDSGISLENGENLAIENLKTEELVDNLSDKEKVLKNVLSDEIVVVENACCMKKRNKKKEIKKKSVDEEIEKLLKELENDEHKSILSSSICASNTCFSQNSQHPKCKSVSSVNSVNKNITNEELEDPTLLNREFVSDIVSVSNLSSDFKSMNIHVSNYDSASDLLSLETNTKSSSPKKKGKKSKTKAENIKSDLESIESDDKDSSSTVKQEKVVSKEKTDKSKNLKESDTKQKKRPSKRQLAMIHEALKKAKEEEERLHKEEEAKRKMAEEAEKIRLEKLKLEQEKKERKKLKEKQRREKMKAEGRLLSKSQKQSRARMEATLAALRQQGVDVPQICDKKPNGVHGPRLGNCKNFHRKRYDSCQSTQSSDSAVVIVERQKCESFSSQESSGKESLSDLPSSFDLTDESALTAESDKGNFSCSEESDVLDDISCKTDKKTINTECKKVNEKTNTKTGLQNLNEIKCSESSINSVKLRSPVVCVLGHVDTGKTKILDYIRKTHVQDSEAGGITQQIGATMIPHNSLKEKSKMVKDFITFDLKIPGLLVIDTPGHESFSNLRLRGSSICDIAILVVDIMHGLEPQTIESINLLKKGKTPFVVALNKIDRIYGWKSSKDSDIEANLKDQSPTTQMEFKKRCQEIVLQFANQCLNAALFYENSDPRSYISMVPTSAITGDGMGNILATVAQLTQSLMHKKLIYSEELEATVLEVKAIPGLGTTIDVILVNGRLQEGDTIVLAGQEGPIVTQIRSLLMPQPLKELRVKNPYIEYKTIDGAQGVKITGKDLEKSCAGLPLLVAHNHSMIDALKSDINCLFHSMINSIKTSERGVYVQASTLGSLEALLDYLTASGIPYFGAKIGPVVKKDVMKASIMLEHDVMYAAILAFDVKIERDAQELADSLGVNIFHADIIYHLFDMYIKYKEDLLLKRQEDIKRLAVFPCKLKIHPEFIFSPKDPIVLGVLIEAGTLKEGTPICVPSRDILEIGVVSVIEVNNSKVGCAKKGENVCITINTKPGESPKTYGKHFSHEDLLVSRITRQSIDICKEHYRNELQSSDWHLMVELKKMLHIM